MAETSLFSTFSAVVVFIAVLACLPWLLRKWLQQRAAQSGQLTTGLKVGGAVAVGPHQRVVVVEVGPEGRRTTLVLGVTAQHVSCLHVMDAAGVSVASVPTQGAFAELLSSQTMGASAGLAARDSSKDMSHGG